EQSISNRGPRVQGRAGDRSRRQGLCALRPRRSVPPGQSACGRKGRSARSARDCSQLRPRAGTAASFHQGSRHRRRSPMTRLLPVAAASGLLLWAGSAWIPARADAQLNHVSDARFAGLQWTFVRIRDHAWTVPQGGLLSPEDEPWFIDAPAAEQNLSRRVRTVTAIQVNDPVVLTLEDPNLWTYPWIYMVEPGHLRRRDAEVPIRREFVLRGGTLTFDDFHGPIEWANLESELRRV